MKTQELIRWAKETILTTKDLICVNYLKQIIDRGEKIIIFTQKSDGYMRDLEEYLGQLVKRGVVYGQHIPERKPEPAESKEVLRKDGVSSGGGTKG